MFNHEIHSNINPEGCQQLDQPGLDAGFRLLARIIARHHMRTLLQFNNKPATEDNPEKTGLVDGANNENLS